MGLHLSVLICGISLLVGLARTPTVLAASLQETEQQVEDGLGAEGYEHNSKADADETRFTVGLFAGQLSGGTPVGSSENIFFRTTFEQGSDALVGGRISYGFMPRLHFELEYSRSSPGLNVLITDLAGQGRTEAEFSDLDVNYLSGSIRFNLTRSSIRPHLTVGVANVSAGSTQETIDESAIGLVFGGGVQISLLDNFTIRADVRGLRSKLELVGTTSSGVTNEVMWTAGLALDF